jgi:hypothetical protein
VRTEARVGRPFSIPREIAEICNGAILRTPEGEVIIEGESAKALDVTWQDSQPGQIQLVLDVDGSAVREAARKSKVDLESVEVVALVAVPMLRHTEVIWRERLSRLDGEVVVDVVEGGSATFREMLEANCPVSLTSYVVLAEGVPREGWNPYRAGTWMSRGRFSFGKVTRGLSFALSALTEEHYEAGVARKAMSYLEVREDLTTHSVEELAIEIFLNKDLLARLLSVDTPASAAVKAQLEIDVVAGLLGKLGRDCIAGTYEDWKQLEAAAPESAAVDLITNVSRITKSDPESVLEHVIGGDLEMMMTALQAELKILDVAMVALTPTASED